MSVSKTQRLSIIEASEAFLVLETLSVAWYSGRMIEKIKNRSRADD